MYTIRKIKNGFVIESDEATIGANSPDKVVLYLAGLLKVPIESLSSIEDDFYKELMESKKKRGKK